MTDMEYTIKTLDRMADLYAKIGQAAEKREEWKTRNLLLGAWMATLLAKQHIKRKMPSDLEESKEAAMSFENISRYSFSSK